MGAGLGKGAPFFDSFLAIRNLLFPAPRSTPNSAEIV